MVHSSRVRLAVLVVAALLAVYAAYLGWQAVKVASLLSSASAQAQELRSQVVAGDIDAAQASLARLEERTAAARDRTDSLAWRAAEVVPFLGDDVRAVRVVSRETDRVAQDALPPAIEVADRLRLDAFSPRDGAIDLDNLDDVAPSIARASATLTRASDEVRTIRTDRLISRLARPVAQVQDELGSAARAARSASSAADLLPTMLGGDGRRTYLLMVQNNAEARSLGGIPGSWAVLRADRGKISMGRQGSVVDVPPVQEARLSVPEDDADVLPSVVATDLRNTTIDPDFPAAARFAAALVGDKTGEDFDGVVSVDPVAMSYVLGGIGEVGLGRGRAITATNAVQVLLNGIYLDFDPDEQNDLFADAARRIFDRVVSGKADPTTLLRGLVKGAAENRVMVWAEDESLQEQLVATTGLTGHPGVGRSVPQVGVYVNDAAGSKMQYYLRTRSVVEATRCEEDVQTLALRTTLTSDAPADAAGLPFSVVGPSKGIAKGDQRVNVYVVAPAGGSIEDLRIDGEPVTIAGGVLRDRQVAVFPVVLSPGGSTKVAATLTTGDGQAGRPLLTTTPGVTPGPNDVRSASACG